MPNYVTSIKRLLIVYLHLLQVIIAVRKREKDQLFHPFVNKTINYRDNYVPIEL